MKSVTTIVDECDYDGIDLDWEYPDTHDEVRGFERLCRQFRKQLDEVSLIGLRWPRHSPRILMSDH